MKIVQVAVGRAFGVFKDNGIDCLNFSGLSTLIFMKQSRKHLPEEIRSGDFE